MGDIIELHERLKQLEQVVEALLKELNQKGVINISSEGHKSTEKAG